MWFLQVARKSVPWSIFISLIFGALAISISITVCAIINRFVETPEINREGFFVANYQPAIVMTFPPASLVHLWLPLFLIGALLNSGLRAFFRTAGLAQRFIKHGDEHPFDAIGIVAAILVFVVTMIWQIAVHFI